MAHRTLNAGAGKAGVVGVALALDGIVDDANGGTHTHMDGAHCIKKDNSLFLEHGFSSISSKGAAVEAFGAP